MRADNARLSSERNIGKKMDRFRLCMSKCMQGSIYAEKEVKMELEHDAQIKKWLTKATGEQEK